ncbi:hypothetical protein EDC04DRAFT_2611637 [Pisolithus marmoratus]|nr:hypothetical protein EDC04DRAFT_2611637 [Pisolithus marmoratus]
MYIHASALLFPVYALASLATAAAGGIEASSCPSGIVLCCTQTYPADSTGVAKIHALLGYTVTPLVGPFIAIGCTPYSGTCAGEMVCCQSSQDNNLVYVGCYKMDP